MSSAPNAALSTANGEAAWLCRLSSFVQESEAGRRELKALARERDPEILAASLLSFASRHSQNPSFPTLEIYQRIAVTPEFYGAAAANNAHDRAEALQGRGDFSARAEIFTQRFARDITDPAALAGMAVAGGVYQGLRLAAYGRLLASPSANFLTRGWGARALSGMAAFSAEAPAFTATLRSVNGVLGREQQWSASSLGHELASGYLMLGALRLSGMAGESAFRRFSPALPAGSLQQKLFQQGVMFSGVSTALWLEERAGMRSSQGSAALFADSLATMIHFNAAGRLLHGLGGGAYTRAMEMQRRQLENSPPSLPPNLASLAEISLASGPRLAFVGPRVGPRGILGAEPMQMSAQTPEGKVAGLVASKSAKSESPVILAQQNPKFYVPYRTDLGHKAFNFYRILSEQESGNPLWIEPSIHVIRYLIENLRADSPRLPREHAPTQELIVQNLDEIWTNLEVIRQSEAPKPFDANARKLLGLLYGVPNQLINYINNGQHGSLQGSLQSALESNKILRNEILPSHIVNWDSGETSTQNLPPSRGARLFSEALAREPSPFYDYADSDAFVVEIPSSPQHRVLLIGDVPSSRGALVDHHEVQLGKSERRVRTALMEVSLQRDAPRRVQLLRDSDPEPFDYVEAYNALDLQTLRTDSGRISLERDFFNRIRPSGIGLWIDNDFRSMDFVIRHAMERDLADVIAAEEGATPPLPLPSRQMALATNYVFFRKLPQQ